MRRRSACRLLLRLLVFLPLLPLYAAPPPAPPVNRTPEAEAEIEALTAFRLAVQDPLLALAGWDPTLPSAPCSWRGVSCSTAARVVELRLPRLRLAGPISPRLAGLSLLRKLSLRSNQFAGPIPASLAALGRLRSLFLQYNSLSGPLHPALLSNLTDLQTVNIAVNRLSGTVPAAFPPKLRYLDLSSNALSGPIPADIPSSAPRIQLLNLSFNRLQGTIPPSLGRLQSLLYLWLDWNLLEGTIPAALANCSALLHLSLQGNALQGIVPAAVGKIPTLQILSLAHNRLSGPIPTSILFNASAAASAPPSLRIVQLGFNAFSAIAPPPEDRAASTVLQVLDIRENLITGPFPVWLPDVSTLTVLDLSGNNFSGPLPVAIGRLSALQELRVRRNSLSGPVPADIGRCGSLQVLDLEDNRFSGEIPAVLSEITGLRTLSLGGNLFSGGIPASLGNLSKLEALSLSKNHLTGGIPDELLQLSNLTLLDLAGNGFSGQIPAGVGSLGALQSLNLSDNGFSGEIPAEIGKLSALRSLDMSGQRNLSGELPDELFGLPNLEVVSLARCSFSGPIPEGFSSLWSLNHLNLTGNVFSGSIPTTYGYLQSLQVLALSNNNISGPIPPELGNCSNLTTLQLRSNHLSGHIPADISRLSDLAELDLGRNDLSGEIPREIAQCSSLVILRLDGNHFSGDIPDALSNLSRLQTLDLSANNLTGEIPPGLARIAGLSYLNVSMNELEGEIPLTLGARFFNPSLFAGNPNLCGEPLGTDCGRAKRRRRSRLRLILLVVAAAVVAVLAVVLLCCCCVVCLFRWRRRFLDRRDGVKKRSPARGSGSSAGSGNGGENGRPKLVMFDHKFTYAETVEATRQFDEENVLSRGRHGLVFKTCYNDGTVLSILRLPSTSADGAIVIEEAFFRKEAESLGKVKHRNLTVLRGYYAGPPPDVRLLVYDYMPNGNLATLLQEASHQDGHILNWPMRHLIALGVARGLAFLHANNVVHGDVKPQNVLFDADFEPHLSDFGLEQMAVTPGAAAASTSATPAGVGSVGYVAPDAAAAGQGTREGDVYSFGIVLLELLTGRRPGMFGGPEGEEEDIVKWVKRQLQRGQISELLEPGLLELDPESSEWEEFLLGVKVGLLCTAPDPLDRPSIADVVFMLEGCRVGPDVPSSADPTSQPSPA